jgi:hypothetical protein
LALLEACGDVVATDRVGPKPSADFTENVLAASRSVRAERVRLERWRRFSIWTGAGVAAAAALMLFALPLGGPGIGKTSVKGRQVSATEVDANEAADPLVRRLMLQTIRAMDATGRGAQVLGTFGTIGLREVHDALQRGLSDPAAVGPDYFGGSDSQAPAGPFDDLIRILENHQPIDAADGLEIM